MVAFDFIARSPLQVEFQTAGHLIYVRKGRFTKRTIHPSSEVFDNSRFVAFKAMLSGKLRMRTLIVITILWTNMLCGCSRSLFQQHSEPQPSSGSVENLLTSVDGIAKDQSSFELFVPNQLTLKGQPIRQDVAMAIVLDRILKHGLFPVGFEERQGGRLYKYKNRPSYDKDLH